MVKFEQLMDFKDIRINNTKLALQFHQGGMLPEVTNGLLLCRYSSSNKLLIMLILWRRIPTSGKPYNEGHSP